jgi:RNA polymerase sigma factor for flagellar operon FliA
MTSTWERTNMTATLAPVAGSTPVALWTRYRSDGDPEARALLLKQHLKLVHHVAAQTSRRVPAVAFEEMVSAGTCGLIRALDSFDLSRGLAFSTYAVQRIRGAILDDLRDRDWIPRSVRAKSRRLLQIRTELAARLGRAPAPAECAEALGLDMKRYWRWCDSVGHALRSASDEAGWTPETQRPDPLEELGTPPEAGADAELALRDRADRLRLAVGQLPERERRVVALNFYEELTLKEIAALLGVSEARVCQIRQRAMQRLKEQLRELSNA